jgi:ABC-type multidrug transport system fused ATPase/permease subunit
MTRAYYELLTGYRRRSAVCVLLLATAGLAEGLGIGALLPLLSGALNDPEAGKTTWFGLQGDELVAAALAMLVVFGLLASLLRYTAEIKTLRLQADVERSLRLRMTSALLGMRWTAYLKYSLGDTAKSILIEVSQIGTGILYLVQGIGYCAVAVVFIAVAFVISPIMTAATLVFGVITGLGYLPFGRRAHQRSREYSEQSAALTEATTDVLTNAKFYRSTGLRSVALQRTDDEYGTWRQRFLRVQRYQPLTRLVFDTAALVFMAVVLGVTLFVADTSPLTPIVFLALFYRLAPKLQLAQQGLLMARSQGAWYSTWKQRYDEAVSVAEPVGGSVVFTGPPTIAFDDVSYSFPGTDQAVVESMAWKLEAGACLAVIGESGAGKTTVLDLVTGLLHPTAGAVRLDGVDLGEADLESWRSRIGFVMQDTPIFHGTVLENVAWTTEDPDRARAERAIEMAHLTDAVADMTEGLDTHVGYRGARLSGGQRQRLALARALYRDPWLLILDEATSALDSEAEQVVQEALASLRGSCSILLVAHRLKTVEIADEILVLAGGRVVERGTWSALRARSDGVFRRLLVAQGAAVGETTR